MPDFRFKIWVIGNLVMSYDSADSFSPSYPLLHLHHSINNITSTHPIDYPVSPFEISLSVSPYHPDTHCHHPSQYHLHTPHPFIFSMHHPWSPLTSPYPRIPRPQNRIIERCQCRSHHILCLRSMP